MKQAFLLVFAIAISMAFPAGASEEQTAELKINGHMAQADLLVPDGGSIANGVVVITHGTLAHKDMELITALQTALGEQGVASLAHTLTLGQDRRKGMFDCAAPHTHKHENAIAEIGAWVSWLKKKGAGSITLLGHSRGGNQVARYASEHPQAISRIVLLAASTAGSAQKHKKSYEKDSGVTLSSIAEKAEKLAATGKADTLMSLPRFLICRQKPNVQADTVLSYYGKAAKRDTVKLLDQLKGPVLVIAGSKDNVVPDLADSVRPKADGKKVSLEVIEGANHFFLDFFVEDAVEKIAAFIKPGS